MAKAYVKVRADSTRLKGDLTGAKTKVTSSVRGMVSAINPILATIGVGAGLAGFTQLLRAGEDFNRKMRGSLAIMGDVSEAMREEMKQAAFEAARSTMFGAGQAAEAYYFLASAGLDAQRSIAAMPQVAMFAQAGMFDLARATDLATDAQSALGLTVKDSQQNLENMKRVTDVLVKANTLANASVEQFSMAITTKAGAAAKVVGKDIEELVAMLAAFADQGVKGQEAGTAVNIVLRDLQTAVRNNGKAFERAGIAVFNAAGEMNNMADIIGDLEKRLSTMSAEQKKTELATLGFADRSMIFIQILLGMSEKMRLFEKDLRKAGGTTKMVADKQLTPLQKGMAKLGASFTEASTSIMKVIGPALGKMMEQIAGLVSNLIKMSSLAKSITASIIGLTAAFFMASIAVRGFGMAMRFAFIGSGVGIALAVMGTLLGVLIDRFDLLSKIGPIIDKVQIKFKGWGNHIKAVSKLAVDLFRSVADVFTSVWEIALHKVSVGLEKLFERKWTIPFQKGIYNAFENVTKYLNAMLGSWEGMRIGIINITNQTVYAVQAAWTIAVFNIKRWWVSLKLVWLEVNLWLLKTAQTTVEGIREAIREAGKSTTEYIHKVLGLPPPQPLKGWERPITEETKIFQGAISVLEAQIKNKRVSIGKELRDLRIQFEKDFVAIGQSSIDASKATAVSFAKLPTLIGNFRKTLKETREEMDKTMLLDFFVMMGGKLGEVLKYLTAPRPSIKAVEEEAAKKEPALLEAGRVGFAEYGRQIQDALLQRDDPQKKTADNTEVIAKWTETAAFNIGKAVSEASNKFMGMLLGPD